LFLPLVLLLILPDLTRAETAVQAWVQRYYGGYGRPTVAVDGSNNVIVAEALGWLFGAATIKYSSVGVPLWTNRYNQNEGEWTSYPTAMAVDADDSAIVTGYSQEWYGGAAGWTVKYSSSGVPLWTNRYGVDLFGGYGIANAVAVDGSNNVICTYDYTTVKYSSVGVPIWTNLFGLPASDGLATGVVADGSNNVIVTGFLYGSPGFATIKYSSAGTPLWTNRCGRNYDPRLDDAQDAMAVAVDGSNNVIVMAYSGGGGSSYDYATIKYSSAGVPLWTNYYNGPGNGDDYPRALAVDASNNVIVTGASGPALSTNYATIKYSSAGVPLWTNRYSSPGSTNDCAQAVAVDENNNVIVTGYSMGSGTSYDYTTIGYSSAGAPLWTNRYNGPGNSSDYPAGMAVDGNGDVIVTGYSTSSGSPPGSFATVKYSFPLLLTQSRPTAGGFEMLVDNLQPVALVIEAAGNLSAISPDWSPVFTNTMPTNGLTYTDTEAGSLPARFYRAVQSP